LGFGWVFDREWIFYGSVKFTVNLKEDEMKTITLQIEDSKFEQFMTVIHSLKSDLINKLQIEKEDDEFKIDEKHCLEVLDKINRGDFSGFEPMGDIDEHIQELKNAIG
jgi:hypothetical protein